MAKLKTYNTRRKLKALKAVGWSAYTKKASERKRRIAELRVKQKEFSRFVNSFDTSDDGVLVLNEDAVTITTAFVEDAKKRAAGAI